MLLVPNELDFPVVRSPSIGDGQSLVHGFDLCTVLECAPIFICHSHHVENVERWGVTTVTRWWLSGAL